MFESVEAGVKLQLPAGDARTVGSANPPEDPQALAVVTNPSENWRFELRAVPLDRPVSLRSNELPEGGRQAGLLELTAADMQRRLNGDLLRLELAPLPDADAGVFAVRYTLGPVTQLRQDALIRANDRLYYRLTLVSPAPAGDVEALSESEEVKRAVVAFREAFDSFESIDQSALRDEQEKRLVSTRAMLVNLQPRGRLAAACGGEQWWIIKQAGQPVGFAQVIEEAADSLPPDAFNAFSDSERPGRADPMASDGVRVGVRLRMQAGETDTIDRASWSYASRQLDEGDFREANILVDEEGRAQRGVVIGQMRSRKVPVRDLTPRGPGLGSTPTFDLVEQAELEVTFTLDGHVVGDPLVRQVPVFYVPRAIDHLLPRLLATWGKPQGYMVAAYAPDRREIFSRYLDVGEPEVVTLPAGGQGRAIVVTSRMGYSGQPTRHFIDPKTFVWLGSSTPSTSTQIYPVTREALEQALVGTAIWDDAERRPDVPDVEPVGSR